MLRKSVLELSSRLSIKRFPRNLGAQQRFHLSSSRNGKNGFNGADKPNMTPPLPPLGKPEDGNGGSAKVVVGGVAVVGACLVAYQTGYLDQYLGKEKEKASERVDVGAILKKLEEARDLKESTGSSSSVEDKAETQRELPHFEASEVVKSDKEVQPESDPTPDRFTYISPSQEKTPQESDIDTAEKSLPVSSDDNAASEDSKTTETAEKSLPVSSDDNAASEDSKTKSDTSPTIVSESDNVKLEAVPNSGDSTVVSDQSVSVHRESEMESASPKDPATENAPEDGIEREVEVPGSLLKEYNLEGSDTESNGSGSIGEQITKETEALASSVEALKDGHMTEDGKLVLDFIAAIHLAEHRQAFIDAQVSAEELRTVKEKYENELRDLRARELMRIEEAAILDKELKREKTKAAAAIKAVQERMEDKLKTEIEQKETEAKIALSNAEELAKAELNSAIAKEKAALVEKLAEVDLNIKALSMAFYARSEEARQSHSLHKLAWDTLALDDTLSKGLPIQKDIDTLQSYLDGVDKDSILGLVLSSLPEEARVNGTDTVLQLNQKFNTLKGTLRRFSLIPPGGGGMLAHSLAHVASSLKFEEVDEADGSIESVIKKVENYLAEGKLAEAAATLEEGVKGSKAEEIASDWVKQARNRAITEQALTFLQSYATCVSLT